jgi:hypothetical protein
MKKIKRRLRRLRRKLIRFFMWIMRECQNWQTIVLLLLVAAVIQLPTWGGYLLYWIFGWKWALALATVAVIFWAGPFSPFWVLCVSITLAIKRAFNKITHDKLHLHRLNHKEADEADDTSSNEQNKRD